MSLYSQNYYGQPYTNPPVQPPQNGYHHTYQQPYQSIPAHHSAQTMGVYHIDPVTFRRDYANRLAELTINSRPIIQNLSYIAQEYSRFADSVVECIDGHIRRVLPWMKLPAFYLLDAIAKNLYEPYARHFAAVVTALFLDTYNAVDASTRSKMEEMLLTWRTASPTGKELFGVAPQVAIERGVWGVAGNGQSSTAITTGQVLRELEFTLGQKERALQSNPYDSTSQKHISILHQLRTLVENGVSQDQLQMILNQLRSLMRSHPPPTSTSSAPAAIPPPSWPSSYTAQSPTSSTPLPAPPQPPLPQTNPSYPIVSINQLPVSSSISPTPVAPPNIANLLSTLVKAGIVSANSSVPKSPEEKVKASEPSIEADTADTYRRVVLCIPIQLNSNDILRQRPPIVDLLYKNLNVQCKQCGIRFRDTDAGKKSLDDHLDVHFKQNRKANQSVGRGHSRSLFVTVEDWIHETTTDIKGKGRQDGAKPNNAKAAADAAIAKRDAELRERYVIVPPGEEAKPKACPICKESLKSEFLEDLEDWVWKNAVVKDERIFHATCHAEAMNSTSSLAARLRHEVSGHRSRSGTPEAYQGRSTPPPANSSLVRSLSLSPTQDSKFAGTKRKVEDEESVSNGEITGTPPLKRVTLWT